MCVCVCVCVCVCAVRRDIWIIVFNPRDRIKIAALGSQSETETTHLKLSMGLFCTFEL